MPDNLITGRDQKGPDSRILVNSHLSALMPYSEGIVRVVEYSSAVYGANYLTT